MSSNDKPLIRFGDKYFRNVTNETTASEVFTTREARVYGETGIRIYEGYSIRRRG